MSSGSMSLLMTEQRGPGPDVCQRIAQALDVSETLVFVEAGLLNPPRRETEANLRELYELLKDLPIEEQRAILAEARERWREQHGDAPELATSS